MAARRGSSGERARIIHARPRAAIRFRISGERIRAAIRMAESLQPPAPRLSGCNGVPRGTTGRSYRSTSSSMKKSAILIAFKPLPSTSFHSRIAWLSLAAACYGQFFSPSLCVRPPRQPLPLKTIASALTVVCGVGAFAPKRRSSPAQDRQQSDVRKVRRSCSWQWPRVTSKSVRACFSIMFSVSGIGADSTRMREAGAGR
jgi:hypothetical protein